MFVQIVLYPVNLQTCNLLLGISHTFIVQTWMNMHLYHLTILWVGHQELCPPQQSHRNNLCFNVNTGNSPHLTRVDWIEYLQILVWKLLVLCLYHYQIILSFIHALPFSHRKTEFSSCFWCCYQECFQLYRQASTWSWSLIFLWLAHLAVHWY